MITGIISQITGMTDSGRTPKYNGSSFKKMGMIRVIASGGGGLVRGVRTPVNTSCIRAYFRRVFWGCWWGDAGMDGDMAAGSNIFMYTSTGCYECRQVTKA